MNNIARQKSFIFQITFGRDEQSLMKERKKLDLKETMTEYRKLREQENQLLMRW